MQTLYTYPDNFRAYKALIAAQYSGAKVTVAADFVFGETNKSEAFLKKFPTGKVSVLSTPDQQTESRNVQRNVVVLLACVCVVIFSFHLNRSMSDACVCASPRLKVMFDDDVYGFFIGNAQNCIRSMIRV